jgi:hypothetical protein
MPQERPLERIREALVWLVSRRAFRARRDLHEHFKSRSVMTLTQIRRLPESAEAI